MKDELTLYVKEVYQKMIDLIPDTDLMSLYKNKDFSFLHNAILLASKNNKEKYVKITDNIYFLISIPDKFNEWEWPGTVDNQGHYYEEYYFYYEDNKPIACLFNMQDDLFVYVEHQNRNKGVCLKFVNELYENFDKIKENNIEKYIEYMNLRSNLPKGVSCLNEESLKSLSRCKYIETHKREYIDEIKEIKRNERNLLKKIYINTHLLFNNLKGVDVDDLRKNISNRI